MPITEIRGNVFNHTEGRAIVHCISEDCAMKAGFAKTVTDKYPEMRSTIKRIIQERKIRVGQHVTYGAPDGNVIVNLITKGFYYKKPTYDTMRSSLKSLYGWCIQYNQKRLVMPTIGCGLDRLQWAEVKFLIKEELPEIDVLVCML